MGQLYKARGYTLIYYDTETCGFHGPTVLIQWAVDDGDIQLHNVWKEPIQATIDLIDDMMRHEGGLCGFNLSFDHFHLCQTYTVLQLLGSKVGWEEYPEDHIEDYAMLEPAARDGLCLKPVTALDLMLHARKGPYQSTMQRGDIRIRKVPSALANELADELGRRIPLKDLYFAKKKNKKERWKVYDIKDDLGEVIEDFKDVVLKFAPTSALKALAGDALGIDVDKILLFSNVEVDEKFRPEEMGFAPFALALGSPGDWKGTWPDVIQRHINHWEHNTLAREYARDDVKYLQLLWKYFKCPEPGDDDSILACMVGAVRWRGFAIDSSRIAALRLESLEFLASIPFNVNSVVIVRRYLEQVLDDTSKTIIQGSTKKIILEDLAKWTKEEVCNKCQGMGENQKQDPCPDCEATGLIKGTEPHPVAARAKLILDARKAKKRIELFDKLLLAGRFHADMNVIGALSSRMSGGGGLNAQGVNKEEAIRDCFDLAFGDLVLWGGDFDGFEVVLMDAAYGDPKLRAELEKGKKIHGLFGTKLFPGKSYEDILATKQLPEGQNLYSRSKNGVFAIAYGGEEYTLMTRVGVTMEAANEAYQSWIKEFKVWGEERQKIFDDFCSMRQPNGIGTNVEWHEPKAYVESLFGFKRFFTLENSVCRALYDLSTDPPKEWTALRIKVMRRDRVQSVSGAVRSALYGAAFQVQAANMRAAGNHVIQSAGATLCKALQRRIWDVQPAGANRWRVQPLNIHDEIMAPVHPSFVEEVKAVQAKFIEEYKEKVPLLAMAWDRLDSWAGKR